MSAALESCEECWTVLANGASILARARHLDAALELARRAREHAPPGKIPGIVAMVEDAVRWDRRLAEHPSALAEAGFHSTAAQTCR